MSDPVKNNSLALISENEIVFSKGVHNAIEIRRAAVKYPNAIKRLSKVDKDIFMSSTKTQISDIEDSELVSKMGEIFRYIAMDVGYIIPSDAKDWIYICTRLLNFIKRYYYQLTLTDIRLAFELLTAEELDEFLTKDKDGKADRKHYQQFNVEYFGKVLNAYKKRQNRVIDKVYTALPETKNKTDEQIIILHNKAMYNCLVCFLKYKYLCRLEFALSGVIVVYNWLLSAGLADSVTDTEKDRETALNRFYLERVSSGLVNRYTVGKVRNQGIKSDEIDYLALDEAKKREIKKAFDRMIKDEIYIFNYLNFRI